MKKLLYSIILSLGCTQLYACNKNKELNTSNGDTMKLKITIGDKTAMGVLYNNSTNRDFATMLPLTIEMDDYASNEKIFYPSRKLSTEDAPKGFDPSVGDLTYYAPWVMSLCFIRISAIPAV